MISSLLICNFYSWWVSMKKIISKGEASDKLIEQKLISVQETSNRNALNFLKSLFLFPCLTERFHFANKRRHFGMCDDFKMNISFCTIEEN